MKIFEQFAEEYGRTKLVEMTLQDYLLGCREDAAMRATAAERMVGAIGEPELIDTSQDQRLSRIFLKERLINVPAWPFQLDADLERSATSGVQRFFPSDFPHIGIFDGLRPSRHQSPSNQIEIAECK